MRDDVTIDVQVYQQTVDTPGRFEGETAATAYYYEAFLSGDGEWVGDFSLFTVTHEEMLAFGLAETEVFFLLRQDGNGFIRGYPSTAEMVVGLQAEIADGFFVEDDDIARTDEGV